MTALTLGRGGVFARVEGRLTYFPSGQEPTIWLYARSGLPFHARPACPPGRAPHKLVSLTYAKIDRLRAAPLDGRLDFKENILPLLKLEMIAAFHCSRAASRQPVWGARLRARLTSRACPQDPGERALAVALESLRRSHGRFDADRPFQTRLPEEAEGPGYSQ